MSGSDKAYGNMWKDHNDSVISLVFKRIEHSEYAPYTCPECGQRSLHIYMQLHNADTRRGGLWIWCSDCRRFCHCSHYIPLEWENASCIEPEKLCAVPDYLDKLKDEIDGHLNMQVRQREMVSGNFHLLYTGAL